MNRKKAESIVREFYMRGGRIRRAIPERLRKEGCQQTYKKGYEVRIRVRSDRESAQLIRCLSTCGIRAGNPYRQHHYLTVPVYGKEQVEWFKKEII